MLKFEAGQNVGIIGRGQSIEKLGIISKQFKQCFVLNQFDHELGAIAKPLQGKHVVQIINSRIQSIADSRSYKKLRIKYVMAGACEKDFKKKSLFVKAFRKMRINLSYLPEEMHTIAKSKGLPIRNAGMVAIMFSLFYLKPKNIYICGIDFYQAGYYNKSWIKNPEHIRHQQSFGLTNLLALFIDIVKKHPETNFHIVTYASRKLFPKMKNLKYVL